MKNKNISVKEVFGQKSLNDNGDQINKKVEGELVVVEGEDTAFLDRNVKKVGKDSFESLNELRLSQNFAAEISVKKMLTTIPVRKPDKQKFVRVHPDPSYQWSVATIELKEENETYIVHPQILPELVGEYNNKLLVVAITLQKGLFVWAIGLPDPDGKDNLWHRSAREAAEYAKKAWIRVVSNRELGAYEIHEAERNLAEPLFPDLTMQEIIKIAFKDKIISDLEHPLIQQLKGR